ncbi:MAG TPA: glycosyltransferase [Bacillales bacterium]|nr:glycosyltransferase [Bacillales bacterium]
MKVAYVTTYNAKDIRKWSGVGYYIARSLENQSLLLEYIGSLKEKYSLPLKAKQYLTDALSEKLPIKRYLREREPLIVKNYAYQVSKKISEIKPDLVFSPGTIPIAYLECKQPIVIWTDCTFSGMIDFYPEFTNLTQKTIRDGNALESSALKRCKLIIYSSEWAAKTAVDSYQIETSKIRIVPLGANIECNRNIDDIREIIDSRDSKKCNLLFLGVSWYRKGGDIAFEVVKELNRIGLDAQLTVVGCLPEVNEPLPNFVKPIGFISKTTKEGQEKINKFLAESHFLILPTIADCNPVVFCEANSFGVPCLSTNVGGIPTVIKDDVNGKTFLKDAIISEYCTYMSNLFSNYSQYKNLALSSFNEYQSRLNWTVAGKTVKKLLMELM